MDSLFLGIFNAVPCGVLWVFSRVPAGAFIEHQREKEYANALYDELYADSIVFDNKPIKEGWEKKKTVIYLIRYIRDSSLTNLPRDFYPAYTV